MGGVPHEVAASEPGKHRDAAHRGGAHLVGVGVGVGARARARARAWVRVRVRVRFRVGKELIDELQAE